MKRIKNTHRSAKTLRRLCAATVGLLLLLCACSATGERTESDAGVDQANGGQTLAGTVSEMNATSVAEPSAAPDGSGTGTIGTEQPIVPAERETTLELIAEYPLGVGGIPVYLLYESDPASAMIVTPYEYFADENGNIYAYLDDYIRDLQSTKVLKLDGGDQYPTTMYAYDGKIYTATENGKLNIFTMDYGKESSVTIPAAAGFCNFNLFPTTGGRPIVRAEEAFYNADGESLAVDYAIASAADGSAEIAGTMTVQGKQYSFGDNFRIMGDIDGVLTTKEWHYRRFISKYSYYEHLICQYDDEGNPLSRFMITETIIPELAPCSVISGGNECKWYYPTTVTVDGQVFDGVLYPYYFLGPDNTMYLMLVYPDGADLYIVTPGYSNVEMSDLTRLQDPADTAT